MQHRYSSGLSHQYNPNSFTNPSHSFSHNHSPTSSRSHAHSRSSGQIPSRHSQYRQRTISRHRFSRRGPG
ncbi:MAG: hypothetical protein JWN38_1027 [Candidatus Saccharibacteria bacterium]|nr:hypothetical protein [Candidatus Saccharibacteria bacterium]